MSTCNKNSRTPCTANYSGRGHNAGLSVAMFGIHVIDYIDR